VIVNKFLGLNASQGFDRLPGKADLQFPRDHLPQLKTQVGWHFFVGSCWYTKGREFGVEYIYSVPLYSILRWLRNLTSLTLRIRLLNCKWASVKLAIDIIRRILW